MEPLVISLLLNLNLELFEAWLFHNLCSLYESGEVNNHKRGQNLLVVFLENSDVGSTFDDVKNIPNFIFNCREHCIYHGE